MEATALVIKRRSVRDSVVADIGDAALQLRAGERVGLEIVIRAEVEARAGGKGASIVRLMIPI